MKNELSKRYDPGDIEERLYDLWAEAGLFHADEKAGGKTYSVVIPPPNVTGILHMGHALNNTIQDILVRWKRMSGYNTLWMPGTDHAGIATQNVVERKLSREGVKRQDLGRDRFLQKVWEWKEENGATIIRQLKRLGCSCDWDRTRFTMDEGLSRAVKEVFTELYRQGLLYKGDYIINWCPRCTTALSDEEAEHRELDGRLYYIKYPVKGRDKLEKENEDYVVVATTRPETMLGDVAVAVNPGDDRYKGLLDKTLVLPIIKRELRVIADDQVTPEFGTGCLKVTPAHDPVDFELGCRHGLGPINAMNPDATINEVGEDYEGMDRFECRETIIEDLKRRGLFIRSEEHRHAVGHCYRCHTVVEPRLSKQWFVKMGPLAREAIEVVKERKISFYPDRWTKVYLNWMENIRDWCISRQIWWGHRIPVWYCGNCLGDMDPREVEVDGSGRKGVVVGGDAPEKCPDCGGGDMVRDPDVLDTWFSSWLWPFSTMGWPEQTETLNRYYPTDALVTAQEIIFFWVARMIMSGLRFMKDIPFSDVYIHGTVRDETGTKMSKSLGNVIDPLEVIAEVGSDALRFSIISITSQGQDVYLSKSKFELGRNFANKLWNASRYVLMNLPEGTIDTELDIRSLSIEDKWILSNLNDTIEKVDSALEAYRFSDAAGELYEFIWHKYCDWYLEVSKLSVNKDMTRKVLVRVLMRALQLLHPFMPFITEEIWQKLPVVKSRWIMTSKWPEAERSLTDRSAADAMERIIEVITAVRNIRAFWNISHKTRIQVLLNVPGEREKDLFRANSGYIEELAGCSVRDIGAGGVRPAGSVAALAGDIKIFVPIGDAVDVEEETRRINGKIREMGKYLGGIEKKLSNRSFVEKAPAEVVEKERAKKAKFERELSTLKDNLNALV